MHVCQVFFLQTVKNWDKYQFILRTFSQRIYLLTQLCVFMVGKRQFNWRHFNMSITSNIRQWSIPVYFKCFLIHLNKQQLTQQTYHIASNFSMIHFKVANPTMPYYIQIVQFNTEHVSEDLYCVKCNWYCTLTLRSWVSGCLPTVHNWYGDLFDADRNGWYIHVETNWFKLWLIRGTNTYYKQNNSTM